MASDPTPLSAAEMNNLVRLEQASASALKQIVDSMEVAMKAERLWLGEPTAIVGVQHLEQVSMDEAKRRISAAQQALAMKQQVIDVQPAQPALPPAQEQGAPADATKH